MTEHRAAGLAFHRMNLRQKIGQMVFVFMKGQNSGQECLSHDLIKEWLMDQQVGGFLVNDGNIFETPMLVNSLVRRTIVPLLFCSDIEAGTGRQFSGGTNLPNNMAIGATFSEHLAELAGNVTAQEASTFGINIALAPVVDVNTEPANPIVCTRAFGDDPEAVSKMACAFIRGCQSAGVAACVKHFPGHGDTSVDSHLKLPVSNKTRDELRDSFLKPYAAAAKAGVLSLMSAHILFPNVDPELPATLSPRIIDGILRKEIGYDGVVMTDALIMGGITEKFDECEAAIKAVEAGVDVLLFPKEPQKTIDAVVAAVESGRIPARRIDESVMRILTLKEKLGLFEGEVENRFVNVRNTERIFKCMSNVEAAPKIARASITLVKNSNGFAPAARGSAKRLGLLMLLENTAGVNLDAFKDALAKIIPPAMVVQVKAEEAAARADSVVTDLAGCDAVICAVFSQVRAYKGGAVLSDGLAGIVKRIAAAHKRHCVVSFGSPYHIMQFPEAACFVCAYSPCDASQAAAAEAITGKIEFCGRLPVSIPGMFERGHGIVSKSQQP